MPQEQLELLDLSELLGLPEPRVPLVLLEPLALLVPMELSGLSEPPVPQEQLEPRVQQEQLEQ